MTDHAESDLLSNVRQLVFVGERSGEGYFSADAARMVFQAEREPGNPFYQIYLMDMTTGAVERVSPGYGKTTCAWIHPDGGKVLFSSTHADPAARDKMSAELEARQRGEQRRMGFDYDDHYDIYEVPIGTADYRNLTNCRGYNAEGSWSPDGRWIVFASNRRVHTEKLTAEEQARFERDPAGLCDIYIMDADGGNVRRLTDHPGYDGGPFFSPDGRRIVWRRFDAAGQVSEIWTMNADGSDQRPITRMGVMSWAPFYHPSGDYVIFATNRHGFANFELYMVDVEGHGEPVRVTFTDGPDVLPVFTPDGGRLAWATRRGPDARAHIFVADWNDEKARQLLALAPPVGRTVAAVTWPRAVRPEAVDNVRRDVERLASAEMEGRRAGTPGEALATAYVDAAFAELGLEAAGTDGFFQPFEFTSGVSLAEGNSLSIGQAGSDAALDVEQDWRPLAFSRVGAQEAAGVVFAGYGLVAPEGAGQPAYNAYGDLDVRGKWVLVLRYLPENVSPERRQHLNRFAALRFKATEARDRGAIGLLVASGPHSSVKSQLVPLRFDGTVAGSSIAAASLTDAAAEQLLAGAGRTLADMQASLDDGTVVPGFPLPGCQVAAHVALRLETSVARNVIGRLRLTPRSAEALVIGAHVDHLGRGEVGNSLARSEEEAQVHPGADDNASGVAGVIQIARHLRQLHAEGRLAGARRDVLFAAWSGEEIGLLGSSHFVKALEGESGGSLQPSVPANLNLDMVGRLQGSLIVQGVGSSSAWRREVERANAAVGLPVTLSNEAYLPSDATSFYLRGVPFLSAFTGAHGEHHSPRDTADRLDYASLARIAELMGSIAASLVTAEAAPEYVKMAAPARSQSGGGRRAYLGTIPDFSDTSVRGVLLGGVAEGSPAQAAGVQAGDVVVALAGTPLENLYDYQQVLQGVKVGQEIEMVVERTGRRIPLRIVPGSRE